MNNYYFWFLLFFNIFQISWINQEKCQKGTVTEFMSFLVTHTYKNVNCNNQIMLKDCFNSKQLYWKRICIAVLCYKQLARDQLCNCILHYLQPVEGKFTAVSYVSSLIQKHCVQSIHHSPASLQQFFFSFHHSKNFCAEVIKWPDNQGIKESRYITSWQRSWLMFGILRCEAYLLVNHILSLRSC